jgi:hypothetical protein
MRPFQGRIDLQVHKIDFCTKWTLETKGKTEDLGYERDVEGGQGVATRPQEVVRLAVTKEDGRLILPHNELCAQFDVSRALFRYPVDHDISGFIEPLHYFQKHSHDALLFGQDFLQC